MSSTWSGPVKICSLLFKEFFKAIYDLLPLDTENLFGGRIPRELDGVDWWEAILLCFVGG